MSIQAHISILVNQIIKKILNLKLLVMYEYQTIQMFLHKLMLQIRVKEFL